MDGDGTPDYDANLRIRSSFKNTAPTVPQNVYASQTTDGLTIYWDGATDKETPSHSLRYNLSVKKKGASGEGAYVISPLNLTDNKAQDGRTGLWCITAPATPPSPSHHGPGSRTDV